MTDTKIIKDLNKINNFFTALENTRPFIKVGFQGFPKSGKTYTATELGIGLHKYIGSTKPIVVFDTEESFKALKPKFATAKIDVQTKQSRTLADLNQTMRLCQEGYSDILIIDSITHVYENFLEAYKIKFKRDRLQFQDWGIIKPKWKAEFSDTFVRAKCHIIFTGRAGYEYEQEVNEQGKKEITKSGIRMKAETETAYEPDMLIMMERVQDTIGDDKKAYREAIILGDRTDVIDGKTFKNPTFKDFEPAVKVYLDGIVVENARNETPDEFQTRETGDYYNERKEIEIQSGRAKATFDKYGYSGSMSKEQKSLFVIIFEKVFDSKTLEEAETKYSGFQIKRRVDALDHLLNELKDIQDNDSKKLHIGEFDVETFILENQPVEKELNLN